MRIAQVSPLFESVPPRFYGGTERVVSYLTEELVREGHQVTLFASGDSVTSARLVAPCPRALRLDPDCKDQLAHHILLLEEVFRRSSQFDLIHYHIDYLHYPFSSRPSSGRPGSGRAFTPHLTTLHGKLTIPDLVPLYRKFRDIPVVSISEAQREPLPWLNWQGTVHHGLPLDLLGFRKGPGAYLAFLGRLSREKRGRRLPGRGEACAIELVYEGLDGVVRRTCIDCSPAPRELSASSACFEMLIPPQSSESCFLTVSCEVGRRTQPRPSYEEALALAGGALGRAKARMAKISTSNEQWNEWITRSEADTHMMVTETSAGPYPYAGVPWFSTPFGRDGIITALELLWADPTLARGVLSFLASTQATGVDDRIEAQPGKILHETRRGEMAALGEIPFGLYYGSADATPLFVILACAYHERTGDRDFLGALWERVDLALRWIDAYGDADGDGFVEYYRHSPQGLVHQGWKDSQDSVFHEDGTLAQGPIALCEVQAYVFAARRMAAELASVLGHPERAAELALLAEETRERFERVFWCEELSTYALALDGEKRPCRVRSSNAGHCLYAGISSPDRARRTAQTLLSGASFSGWGIRTIASTEVRFNPMSYHNGSVWPHDNALIALGLARYGLSDLLLKTVRGIFDSSVFFDLHRLPELYCGFPRRPGEGPTLYPVACAPQSWASASVFLFVQAILGLTIHAPTRKIHFKNPVLPEYLKNLQIEGLEVGGAVVDIFLERRRHNVSVNLVRKEGEVEIVVLQ